MSNEPMSNNTNPANPNPTDPTNPKICHTWAYIHVVLLITGVHV